MLPNFIVAGAPKAATTSLCNYLAQHPDVFLSDPKELNFFSAEAIAQQGLYYHVEHVSTLDDYQAAFAGSSSTTARGEGSVSYMFYPNVAAKIRAAIPDVRLIFVLRDPIERALSHFLMDRRLGYVSKSFDEIILDGLSDPTPGLFYQQYVSLGLYYEQLMRYFDLFPREQIRVFLYDDFRAMPTEALAASFRFLGVDDDFVVDMATTHNSHAEPRGWLARNLYVNEALRSRVAGFLAPALKERLRGVILRKAPKPRVGDAVLDRLRDLYQGDVEKTSRLIARDLSAWLS